MLSEDDQRKLLSIINDEKQADNLIDMALSGTDDAEVDALISRICHLIDSQHLDNTQLLALVLVLLNSCRELALDLLEPFWNTIKDDVDLADGFTDMLPSMNDKPAGKYGDFFSNN